MRREDCEDLFKRIPLVFHPQVNLILRGQGMMTVDTVIRFEPHYLVLRGREQGSTDEGRAFFIPYEEIAYLRIERVLKLGEMKKMFGEVGHVDAEDMLGQQVAADQKAEEEKAAEADAKTSAPAPSLPLDPAEIAKKNLLDRIRAARANVAGTTGRLGR